jgi:mannose-6-phosphate isomerase-like protein (cupin superfamily)
MIFSANAIGLPVTRRLPDISQLIRGRIGLAVVAAALCKIVVIATRQRPIPEYHWHKHEDTDDFFLLLKGVLGIELRDRTITLHPGNLYVVPKGVEHRPVARDEVHILLMETSGTPNSGDVATAAPRTFA